MHRMHNYRNADFFPPLTSVIGWYVFCLVGTLLRRRIRLIISHFVASRCALVHHHLRSRCIFYMWMIFCKYNFLFHSAYISRRLWQSILLNLSPFFFAVSFPPRGETTLFATKFIEQITFMCNLLPIYT